MMPKPIKIVLFMVVISENNPKMVLSLDILMWKMLLVVADKIITKHR